VGAVAKLAPIALVLVAAACGPKGAAADDRASVRIPLGAASAAPAPATRSSHAAVPAAWTFSPAARLASYGPPDAPALLAVSCEGSELVIVRYAAADKGAEALFAIQGSKGILRLPVSAVKIGAQGYVWRGILDAADPRAEVLLGSGLKATVPGGGELDLPPLGGAGAVVSGCRSTAGRQASAQTLPNLASNPATSPAAR
jgi:hypothetical protein